MNQINTTTINVCSGGDPAPLLSATEPAANLASLGANITYQWQRFNSGSWTNIASAVLKDYDPPVGSVTTTTQFRRLAFVEILGNSCDINVSSPTTVNVNPTYTASMTASIPSLSICGSDTLTFTAFPSYATATYTYYLNGTTNVVQAPSSVRTYTSTFLDGDVVRVKIEYNGCEIFSDPLTVNVETPPLAQLFAPTVVGNTICINDLPQIQAQTGSSVSYTFYVGDGINQTAFTELSSAVTSNILDLSDAAVSVYNPTYIDVRVVNNSTGCEDDTRVNGGTLVLNLLELSYNYNFL